jgi:hypothetical protein
MHFVDIGKTASSPNDYHTITIANGSSGDSKLIVLLRVGASATSYDQYQFSAHTTAIADPSGIDSSPSHTQCTTLGAMIKAINALKIGFKVYRLNAAADYSLDSNDFVDLTEVAVGPIFTEYLYRDASEVLVMSGRIGVPEEMDAGHIELLYVRAYVDSNSGTDCEMKISQDPNDGDATKEVELGYTRLVPDAAWTDLVDNRLSPAVHQGPILVEFTATVAMAVTTAKAFIHWRSAEY